MTSSQFLVVLENSLPRKKVLAIKHNRRHAIYILSNRLQFLAGKEGPFELVS